ncbi:hypothetical protein B0H10DRAFT_2438462 [Mycena sp. CBHHK59/15]|nr:hypothetical protein B0H10DRAFT_2438462 [Mycena sp. CBHHK59/15]
MAGNPNTVIVMGSSADSYFIGHGRRHFVENMSPVFTNHANTELNISMTTWVSMSKSLETWVDFNVATDKFHFNLGIKQDIRNHLSGANGKFAVDFVSFPDSDDPGHYFVNGKAPGAWTAELPNYFIEKLTEMQRENPNFDTALEGMLFGKGKTHIYQFSGGFMADLDDEITVEHPVYKTLSEFSGGGWCIERGSTLCFYDSRFYYLKFKQPGASTVQMRWNLPQNMSDKLAELKEVAQSPEEQMALIQEDQKWMALGQARINMQMQNTRMMVDVMKRGSLLILAAATGGTVVRRRHY